MKTGRIWAYSTFGFSSRDLSKQIDRSREQDKENKRLTNDNKTAHIRTLWEHQEVGGTEQTFQDLDAHTISS